MLPIQHKRDYARDFCAADKGYYFGQVAATTKNRQPHWANWTAYIRPLGLDPYLQGVRYTDFSFCVHVGTGQGGVGVSGGRCPGDAPEHPPPTQSGVSPTTSHLTCHAVTSGTIFRVRGEPGSRGTNPGKFLVPHSHLSHT
jgi:hypothetical protein